MLFISSEKIKWDQGLAIKKHKYGLEAMGPNAEKPAESKRLWAHREK